MGATSQAGYSGPGIPCLVYNPHGLYNILGVMMLHLNVPGWRRRRELSMNHPNQNAGYFLCKCAMAPLQAPSRGPDS